MENQKSSQRKQRNDKGKKRKTVDNVHLQIRLNGDPLIRPVEAQAAVLWHKWLKKYPDQKAAFINMILELEKTQNPDWKPTIQVNMTSRLQDMLKRAVDLLEQVASGKSTYELPHERPDTPIAQSIADFTYDAQGLMGNITFFEGEE